MAAREEHLSELGLLTATKAMSYEVRKDSEQGRTGMALGSCWELVPSLTLWHCRVARYKPKTTISFIKICREMAVGHCFRCKEWSHT